MFRKQKDFGVAKKRTQSINQLINILWTFISTSVTFSVSKSALWVAEWPNVRRRIISISPISQVISHTVRGIEYALHCSTWCWPHFVEKQIVYYTQTMRAGSSFYCSGKLQSFNSHLWGKIYVEQTRSIKLVMSLDLEYHYVIISYVFQSVLYVTKRVIHSLYLAMHEHIILALLQSIHFPKLQSGDEVGRLFRIPRWQHEGHLSTSKKGLKSQTS